MWFNPQNVIILFAVFSALEFPENYYYVKGTYNGGKIGRYIKRSIRRPM